MAIFGAIWRVTKLKFLGGREVLPRVPVYLDLENSALVSVEEILAVGNFMGRFGANFASRPPRGADTATVQVFAFNHLKAEFDPVPYARRTGGY